MTQFDLGPRTMVARPTKQSHQRNLEQMVDRMTPKKYSEVIYVKSTSSDHSHSNGKKNVIEVPSTSSSDSSVPVNGH